MPTQKSTFLLVLSTSLLLLSSACESPTPEAQPADADTLGALGPGAAPTVIAGHLLATRDRLAKTADLARHYPRLSRAEAYAIQRLSLDQQEGGGDSLVGWKLGGTRLTDPNAQPDPLFGYILASNVYDEGAAVPAGRFVDGAPQVEAEVAFWIEQDLPGPTVTREQLEAAVSVGGAIELITPRLVPAQPGDTTALPTELALADNLSHAGVVMGDKRVAPADLDLAGESAWILVNGEEKARGSARQIMGTNPMDALFWLANERPKHGRPLRAGDFVVTGSLYDNPTVRAGDDVRVVFSTLGEVTFSLTGDAPTASSQP